MKVLHPLFKIIFLCILLPSASFAQDLINLNGTWVINEKLSDDTDKKVEQALRANGQKVSKGWFNKQKDYYRGGPAEQELYDRISYDQTLTIHLNSEEFLFTYDDNFQRTVFTDNRRRSVSLNNLNDMEDFSFSHWEGESLDVEARPRDGGFSNETYTLMNEGKQLRAEFFIKPAAFEVPIELVRIYDRKID